LSTNHFQPGDFTQEQFDSLLGWLDPDREKAGEKHERIRQSLIKFFVCRGSKDPEDLSDETINRVMHKLPEIESKYVGDPARYFHGVAKNIFRESLKKAKSQTNTSTEPGKRDAPEDLEQKELYDECLEDCMQGLSRHDRDLLLGYYGQEKRAKIRYRKEMADAHGGVNALRIWVCRKRAELKQCMENCVEKATKKC
jgi:DNA-directed RNA polymerase specialized sigma24 family protein